MNIQSSDDMDLRSIDWDRMIKVYEVNGIEAVHYPIQIFDTDDLSSKLVDAACILNNLITKQSKKVYIHSTAGLGRASSIVICYLMMYKKITCWSSLVTCDRFMKVRIDEDLQADLNALQKAIDSSIFQEVQLQQEESDNIPVFGYSKVKEQTQKSD